MQKSSILEGSIIEKGKEFEKIERELNLVMNNLGDILNGADAVDEIDENITGYTLKLLNQ